MGAIASALQGITSAENRFSSAALRLTAGSAGLANGDEAVDTVNLSSAAVDLIQARLQVAVSVKIAHAAEDLDNSLLHLRG